MATIRLIILLILFSLFPLLAGGEEKAHEHKHEARPLPTAADAAGVALSEHLGARIPLDASFRDEGGRPVRLRELVTGPTLILPVYYGCTNVCNYLQWGVAGVLPSIAAKPVRDYRVLSVSFDEMDTPERAARARAMYLNGMKNGFPREGWRFLTGDAATIRRLTDAAGYGFKRQGQDMVHPVASFVVTRDGTIVRYLYGTFFLPKDLALAFAEAREGKSGATIRKVVNYCFSFNPASKSYEFNLLRVSATVVALCTGAFMLYLILGDRKKRGRRGADRREPGRAA
ncbi:SCO family protein [Geomonas sp. RF6]|uniref:SCO family protein n=1 Tax=Geomonas sp. RF6 TaxID=2897342 RepID=UPI001E288BC2|nr:SCO family protein [Geomonas sp. RF6]UFS72167.1 SCO family protein [Geomonas sp. RF6]